MGQDDIEYILEILNEATEERDWDLVFEAKDFLNDFRHKNGIKTPEEI